MTIELQASPTGTMIRSVVLIFALVVNQCYGDNAHIETNTLDDQISEKYQVTEINLNDWFDHSLSLIKKFVVKEGWEPMDFPNMSMAVTNIPGFRPKIQLTNGLVHGTTNVTRSGDILVRIYEHLWEVDLQLNWDDVDVTYDYVLKYFLYKRKGSLQGKFSSLNAAMLGSINFQERKVYLRYLKIVDAGAFSLKLRGHLIDPIINAIVKAITVSFRQRVLREIEYQVTEAAQLKIKEVNDWLANQTTIDVPHLRQQLMHLHN